MSNLEEKVIIPLDSKRLRHDDNVENKNEDRLSELPDGVLLHILKSFDTKEAVRTCILSTRWKHIWKRITHLTLFSSNFSNLEIFTKFVSRVLSLRDDSISLQELIYICEGSVDLPLLNRILKYAISHNIQRLELILNCEIDQILSPIFSCQTLTHLSLCFFPKKDVGATLFPKSLNLPVLTSLHLWCFTFCADSDVADPFLTFNKLNCLHLSQCDVRDGITLRISSVTLVKLHMRCLWRNCLKIVELCTPRLDTFVFTGIPHMSRLKGRNLSSVKHVDIDANLKSICGKSIGVDPAFNLFNWLQDFVGIKSLVLTASTLQVLSFIPDLLESRLPFLKNLKLLKVIDQELSDELCLARRDAKLQKAKSKKKAVKLRKEIVDFLLRNSPSAEFEILNPSRLLSVMSEEVVDGAKKENQVGLDGKENAKKARTSERERVPNVRLRGYVWNK